MITVPLPSDAYREMERQLVAWAKTTIVQDPTRDDEPLWLAHTALAQPLNCAAIFYRDADRGDAVGYYQALADSLEAAGVVADDKWIKQWDGSRLAKDANRPRIEVVLTAL